MTEFNEQQKAVIGSIDGNFLVVSGPGSGKTTVLLERHIQMMIRGISQKDILNLTFTAAAAEAMVRRIGILNSESVFRTFHSFALELIKNERQYMPFKLVDTVIPVKGEDYQLLFELCKMYPRISSFRTLQSKLSEWKRTGIDPERAQKEAIGPELHYAMAYEDYERMSRESGWLDFDNLIYESAKLLATNPEVRSRYKKKYLAVDEFQDTDSRQLELLKLLYDGNIMAIGDANQSIYEFRGAYPDVFGDFKRQYDNVQTLFLGVNYRSTGKITEFVKQIVPVDNGLASHMTTPNPEGVDPVFTKYPDTETEIKCVLEKALTNPENSAIIARTNRQLFDVQRMAVARGIKYKNLGKKDFFDANEVKSLLTHLKDENPNRNAAEALQHIIHAHNFHNRYRSSGDPLYSDPIENINNVVKMSAKRGTVKDFLDFVRKATYARKSKKEKDLTLSTCHQAKGLQWDHVYVVGCDNTKMPHSKGEINEERRIFFVSCSRAAKTLDISWSGPRSMFLDQFVDKVQVYGEQDRKLIG